MQVDNVKSNISLPKISYSDLEFYSIHLSIDFSDDSFISLIHTLNVCEQTKSDDAKKLRLIRILYEKCLWDIEEAKELGFIKFLEKDVFDKKRMYNYMEKNNKEFFIKIRSKYNERKESRLCSES